MRKYKGLDSADYPRADQQADLQGADEIDTAGLGLFSSEVSPVWGALVGTGLASAGVLIAKSMRAKSPRVAKYAGLVGLGATALVAGPALFSKKTRRAAYMGLATGAIVSIGELVRAMFVEPQFGDDGEYGAVEILDYEVDGAGMGMYQPEMTDGFGAGIEVMGQTTPMQAMGMYQPEMTSAPVDVMGMAMAPYGGMGGVYG